MDRKARRGRGKVAPAIGVRDFPDLAAAARARVPGEAVKTPGLVRMALRPHKRLMGLFVVAALVQTIGGLSFTAAMKTLVDEGIVDNAEKGIRDKQLIAELAGAAMGWAFVALVGGIFSGYLIRKVVVEVEFDLRTWLYTRVHAADLEQLGSMTVGQLVTRSIADLGFVGLVIGLLPILIPVALLLLGVGIFLIILNPIMGVTAVSALVVNLYLSRRLGPRLRALSFTELNERAEVTVAIDEPVRGIRVVHAFGSEEREAAKVRDTAIRVYRYALARARLIARFDLLLKSLPMLSYATVLFIGAQLVANDDLSLGSFTVAFQFVGGIALFASTFDHLVSVWQFFLAAQRRLTEVLELGDSPATLADGPAPETGHVEVRGVDVELGGRTVLHDLSFEARPGAITLIKGAPGSGKSTAAAVAAGVLPVSAGSVTIGGLPVSSFGPSTAGQVARVVSEESFLFAGTLRENLALGGRPGVTEQEIAAALRVAAADEVVAELDGLDTPVGDRGLTLSGGQRQRIALARALVSPPKVLILDDALSAVQPALEVDILRRIRAYAPEMAIVCITRRTGAASIADAVYTLPEPADGATHRPSAAPAAAFAMDPLIAAALTPEVLGIVQKLQETVSSSNEVPQADEALCLRDEVPTLKGAALRPFLPLIATAAFAAFLLAAGSSTPQVMLGTLADLAKKKDTAAINLRVLVLLVIGVGAAGAAFTFQITMQKFNQSLLYLLRRRLFGRLARLGNDYYDRELPGQIAARVVSDLDTLGFFLQTAGFQVMALVAQVLVTLAITLSLVPGATVPAVSMVVGIGMVGTVQAILLTRANNSARDALGIVTSSFEEDLSGTHELRNLGAVGRQTQRFVQASWELRATKRRVAYIAGTCGALIAFLGNIYAAIALRTAGEQVIVGAITAGAALSVRALANSSTDPLSNISSQFSQLMETRVSWLRLKQPFAAEVNPKDSPGATPCPPLQGRLAFEDVAFTYPGTSRQVLHGLSFDVPENRVVSIVGYTGAGKSSMSKLITRVYDPNAGRVLVDGQDIRGWNSHSFRTSVGVVPQDAFVFKGSVRSNIAYGRPDATQDEIEAAARAVGAHEVFDALPGKYHHPVEEAGVNLTVAQRQLVALARAWLTQPRLLVLDEATSALDHQLEASVLRAVKNLGCTTIMVTHRESVVAASDEVIVLDAGRIVQTGTPAEVMAEGGAFAALWHGAPAASEGVVGGSAPKRKRTPIRVRAKAGAAEA